MITMYETIPAMEREELEQKVSGIARAGTTIVPGLVGKMVCVGMVDGRLIDGQCLGFLTVNKDMGIREPHLTLETRNDETQRTLLKLPPQRIAEIGLIE